MSTETPNTRTFVKENLVAFIDPAGRTGFGELVPHLDTDTTVAIKNPVVVHVVPQGQNMALQLLPAFFREFGASLEEPIIFNYPKTSIALSNNAVFDFKLYGQYEAMFAPPPLVQPVSDPKVVKLFDE
jgi:hypothetical protein